MSKLMMLVAAKWREFSNSNPNTQPESPVESDYGSSSKTSRSRGGRDRDDYDDEDEEREDKVKKKRGRKKGKKGKVPTLKIKLGKRKKGSSVSSFSMC